LSIVLVRIRCFLPWFLGVPKIGRFDRLTPLEREYMRCLADLGPEPQRSADVASRMARKANSVAPTRDSLIRKGMVYSPEHGMIAFTVLLFDEFMRREMPPTQ